MNEDKLLNSALIKESREGANLISYCGFHCDFCFYRQKCGGCRSHYNCCSFATLFEDGICPNVKCAQEKGLCGCYKCSELTDCVNGYYSRTNEYVAKAAAIFIKQYGEECYTSTLRKAIADGVNLNESGSVENAFTILEKYINCKLDNSSR